MKDALYRLAGDMEQHDELLHAKYVSSISSEPISSSGTSTSGSRSLITAGIAKG